MAKRVFEEWVIERNGNTSNDKCPVDLLKKSDLSQINFWLSLRD